MICVVNNSPHYKSDSGIESKGVINMNNTEKIIYIQNKIDIYKKEHVIDYVEMDLLNEIADLLEELKKPQSLADFLGWEEDTEYVYKDYKYKIINNNLYLTRTINSWIKIYDFNVVGLRQAEKVQLKKYHFVLKQEYIDFFGITENENYINMFKKNKNIKESERYFLLDKKGNSNVKTEFTEEEINNIVLPEPLSLDMFDKVKVE